MKRSVPMKKIFALMLSLALVLALTACGGSANQESAPETSGESDAAEETASGGGKHIYILTAAEDHGWTGSVATFAKAKAEQVNAEGVYTAEVITSRSSGDQITQLEDIVAAGNTDIAVVIQPQDDTLESAIQQLVDAGIPYVAFDRIIDGVSASAVSNVKGDNTGIGAGAAAYFVSLGLTPGEKVYVYQGDTSSVTTLRDSGFTEYLLGNLDFDGATIDDAKKWTEDDLNNITYSGAMNWSRSDTKTSFESLMGDSSNAEIKWFYAEDDELAMGILEALSGGGIEDATKEAFLSNAPVITGCGGLDELYEVLRGNAYQDIASRLGGLISVTYSPSMIQTAVQDMVDYLNGESVEQDHVIACENVSAENVGNYQSFS
ncbi:MAG: substrate-binding domain-containing protein [Oscillibacter sp.]|nr:substrate-binding domain-containing protein [Oscillibacter sp.]